MGAAVVVPLDLVRDLVVGQVRPDVRVGQGAKVVRLVGVRDEAQGVQRAPVVGHHHHVGAHHDPGVSQAVGNLLRLFDLLIKELFVDGAVVHVAQGDPPDGAAPVLRRDAPVELDDPADEIGVGLLPEGFLALAEQLIEQGRHGIRQRVRIEPGGAQGIPCHAPVEVHFQVVLAAVVVHQDLLDVVAKIAFHFKDERRGAALGIGRLPAEQLAGKGVHTGGRFPGPDGTEDRHAGIQAALRDHEPFGRGTLDRADRVMHLADDDGGAV